MSSNMQAAVLDRFEEPLLNRKGTPANGKMHAAVVEQFGKALLLQELDIPSPGAGPAAFATPISMPRMVIGQ
jgi:hypothetical protein